jgi:hypothetical protein
MGLSNVKYLSDITAARLLDKAPFASYAELHEYVMRRATA